MVDPKAGPAFDLCCDHGRIGFQALEKGASVTFNDREAHLVEALSSRLKRYHPELYPKAQFITGDAKAIKFPENSQVIVAGVGNDLIQKIAKTVPSDAGCQLILGIQKRSIELRRELRSLGWRLELERLCLEKGRFREVLKLSQTGDNINDIGIFHKEPKKLKLDFFQTLQKHVKSVQSLDKSTLDTLDMRIQDTKESPDL